MSIETLSSHLPAILRNTKLENHKIPSLDDLVTPAIHKNGMIVTQDDLTDDNASDSPQNSDSSAIVSVSDDIIFDDDTSLPDDLARSNSVDYIKEKAVEMLQRELKSARKVMNYIYISLHRF